MISVLLMRLSNKIVLASLNREKFDEFKSLLKAYPEIELIPAEQVMRNAEKLQFAETFETYLENATAKARLTNQACHYSSLADDSGLEVAALEGKPGVKSHRYAPPKAKLTQDQANLEFLLQELKGSSNRAARFVCTLVLVIEGIQLTSTGILEGTLIDSPRGTNGFGYDPLFIPKGETRTLAEMTHEDKNRISHRAKAVHSLMHQVREHGIVFAKP